MSGYDVVIGLEVHAQLLTRSKAFCPCSTKTGLPPNTNTCPVCMGLPGTLPVLNERMVDFGIRLGLATGCTIEERSVFARKNYFYPDLPKGYQITQHVSPLCRDGSIDVEVNGETRPVRIMRIHLEEDAGKTVHDETGPLSFVDYNRSGVPLLEIVSMPDITSTDMAVAYLRELRLILMYLGICDGNMEEGSLRCDANVSVKPAGTAEYGTRTEIKNVNSFRNVQKALEYEIRRQTDILESGGRVEQETRLWNASQGRTLSMRSKEESHDYRYFPEPDLLPVRVDEAWTASVRDSLPELPASVRRRFREVYGLPAYDASVLTGSRDLAAYFEACVEHLDAPKDMSNWIMTEVLRVLSEENLSIAAFPVSPAMLAGLIALVRQGAISGTMAKEVFGMMVTTGRTADEIVSEQGMAQVSDEGRLREIAVSLVEAHPDEAKRYREGKTGLLGFFVGKLMAATNGQANPRLASRVMKETLG
ncbi:MAG TPA: Asp-tRNA(Asn)/Glu-tRNA(Gln) amidotransferase subunit GatB [Deltaproteobacteria bacterium]|nr:Asp-tRNA(Asn)/Glu-tRNA(Gln) amidotransferase subunit GatB [Deltaproteobacteria bacterium]HOI06202.1 Asp-tRNA(Asn)/Glu-tRNA(Gln) amidotransferase subunit GatB [Deltaproteobacteria bacterium]